MKPLEHHQPLQLLIGRRPGAPVNRTARAADSSSGRDTTSRCPQRFWEHASRVANAQSPYHETAYLASERVGTKNR